MQVAGVTQQVTLQRVTAMAFFISQLKATVLRSNTHIHIHAEMSSAVVIAMIEVFRVSSLKILNKKCISRCDIKDMNEKESI